MEQLFSTAVFHAPFFKDMRLLSKHGVSIFAYDFAYKGSMTLNDFFRLPLTKLCLNFFGRHVGTTFYQKDLGVGHGDDLVYLFPFSIFGFPKSLKTRNDQLISQQFLNFVANFVVRGDPGIVDNVHWQRLADVEPFEVMKIDSYLTFGPMDVSKQRRMQFWIDSQLSSNRLSWSNEPITTLHNVIAEKRSSLVDSKQHSRFLGMSMVQLGKHKKLS